MATDLQVPRMWEDNYNTISGIKQPSNGDHKLCSLK